MNHAAIHTSGEMSGKTKPGGRLPVMREVHSLGARGAGAGEGGGEKRASARQTLVAKGVLFLDPGAVSADGWPVVEGPVKVYLVNISMGGVAFRTTGNLEEGRTGRLKVEAGPICLTRRVEILPRRVRSDGVAEYAAKFTGDDLSGRGDVPRAAAGNQAVLTGVPRNPTRALVPR